MADPVHELWNFLVMKNLRNSVKNIIRLDTKAQKNHSAKKNGWLDKLEFKEMDEEETYEELDLIWLESPAYLIDWLRLNKNKIKKHIESCNKFIDKMIDIIN